jgi:hypothetical protein
MTGKDAKRMGGAPASRESIYESTAFTFGSPEHHALIRRAIRAKLEENPEVAKAFAATHPRPIVHDTGRPDRENTSFPASFLLAF